ARQKPHVLFIFDDYHLIQRAERSAQRAGSKPTSVHDGMAFLLERLPPHVQLVLSTRADPTLPLARLRARGELVEVRAADLRFAHYEAQSFLNQTMGLDLTESETSVLELRTDGWIAGLQLVGLALRDF